MSTAIAHRGPDDAGVWSQSELGIALAHQRLSVIDLSPFGHQPMISESGRYVLTFNGEIYNYQEMRADLERSGATIKWRGSSDTEVLLASCERWGLETAIRKANGMFAFALVDLHERTLTLARDRFGEKPLYYGSIGGTFLFASELKALRAHPKFVGELDRESLALYFRFGYVPTPRSIYRGISKLPAAHYLRLKVGDGQITPKEPVRYWTLPTYQPNSALNEEDAIEELDQILRKAVRLRMNSDVPLGAFLSGGIDSSVVTALMQAQSATSIRTFSIGFSEREHSELDHARQVAVRLGTNHTELVVAGSDALAVVPQLPSLYDEPFADSSQIPTYLLAKLTRQHVTVSLSGDGGDEFFAGYNRYIQGRRLLAWARFTPALARRAMSAVVRAIPGGLVDTALKLGPRSMAVTLGDARLQKFAEALQLSDVQAMYKRLVSQWHHPEALMPGVCEPTSLINEMEKSQCIQQMMRIDQLMYLPDDILVKVDRATMAVALEVRVPMLDPTVAEFAARIPLRLMIRGITGKLLLRGVLSKYLDESWFNRPKQGFAVPLAAWLRGPLKSWAEELLNPTALRNVELFDVDVATHVWTLHVSGKQDMHRQLWPLLMFQAWSQRYRAP